MDGEQKQIRILVGLGLCLVLAAVCIRLLWPHPPAQSLMEAQSQGPALSSAADSQQDFPVNINTADWEQLMTLPGIGEAKARAIVRYRMDFGPFQSLEQLKQVKGIGDGILEDIRGLVVLE